MSFQISSPPLFSLTNFTLTDHDKSPHYQFGDPSHARFTTI